MEHTGTSLNERAKSTISKVAKAPQVIEDDAKRVVELIEHVKKLHERVDKLEKTVASLKPGKNQS